MADSWRCARCDINYPDPGECIGCLDDLWENKKVPHDEDWKRKAARAAAFRERKDNPFVPDLDVSVIPWKGRHWVAESLLMDGGYEPDDFMVVQIRGAFYELMGRKADGDVPAWWIEEVDTDFAFEELPELTPTEYRELDIKRGLRT